MNQDKIDFGKDKIGPLFRAIFIPTLVGMIFNTALTIIDGIFVGQGVGADGIAAVNIVAPIFMVCTGIGLMLGIGSSVLASIRLADNNAKAARITMTQAFIVGTLVLGIICLILLIFPHATIHTLGCSQRLEQHALNYLLWLLPGLIFLYLECVGMMLIRLDGAPRFAMWIQITAAVVNIILDWYMVFPLGMGVKGAAMATSIACIIGGFMVLAYFLWFHNELYFHSLKITGKSMLLTVRNTWYMVKIGFATFLTELAMSVMMLTGNFMFMSMLHEDGVAAFAVACYLFPLVFSISNAVAQSAQPIISYNYGSRKMDRVRKALSISLMTAIGSGLLISLGLWIGASDVSSLFLSPASHAYGLAVKGLPLYSTCAVFFAINIAMIGYYQSIEKAKPSTIYTLLRGIILLIPSFIILPKIIGVPGLWLAIPLAEFLTSAIILTIYLTNRHHGTKSI